MTNVIHVLERMCAASLTLIFMSSGSLQEDSTMANEKRCFSLIIPTGGEKSPDEDVGALDPMGSRVFPSILDLK